MTTPPQVPAALCGLYHGARVTIISTPKNGVGTAGRRMEDGCWSVRFDSGDFGWWAPDVLSLLLDSPLAMCHAARWLGARVGWDMRWVTTAPSWERVRTDKGPEWVLRYGNNALYATDVPGIGDMTDPAEALAAACVALGGAS